MKTFVLYTDGACSGNPGIGGWGYLIYEEGTNMPPTGVKGAGGEQHTTNQRMELTAAIAGLSVISHSYLQTDPIKVKIYTDSAYLSNCIKDGWYKKWRYNGWKNTKREDVKNRDLWEELLSFIDNPLITIQVIKVKAHSGNELNDIVDQMARHQVDIRRDE